MNRYNDKQKIRISTTVQARITKSVGAHIHHGYWISGEETKETAQNQLIEHVARAAVSGQAARFWTLDVGSRQQYLPG